MKCCINQSKRAARFALSALRYWLPWSCPSLLWACPFCQDNVPNGMAKGFFWSILLMLAVPAVVVGVIAGTVWRAEQKKRAVADVHH